MIEGLWVLRYLQGTQEVGLSFKACGDHDKVIAYTDANFAIKSSQTGSVIKIGLNTITWRSSKQSIISTSSAESEVQALANTACLADYVKSLRESLRLPTPTIELRCDSTSAIVLATGEGSWRTKSLANKIYSIREQVEFGSVVVSYTHTTE